MIANLKKIYKTKLFQIQNDQMQVKKKIIIIKHKIDKIFN